MFLRCIYWLLYSESHSTISPAYQIYLNPDLAQVIEHSLKLTEYFKDEFVSTEHLFIAMLDVTGEARETLARFRIFKDPVVKILEELRRQNINDIPEPKKFKLLLKYTRNLTKLAKEDKLDPVIGRDNEIMRGKRRFPLPFKGLLDLFTIQGH